MKCINCGRPTVQREGDTFTCTKCGYTWDVAHEQANAHYLEAQGRNPAQPIDWEQATEEVADTAMRLLQELSKPVKVAESELGAPVLVSEEAPVIFEPPTGQVVTGDGDGHPAPDFDPAVERDAEAAYEILTVEDLKALAEERGVDLTGRSRKADIIAALREADQAV